VWSLAEGEEPIDSAKQVATPFRRDARAEFGTEELGEEAGDPLPREEIEAIEANRDGTPGHSRSAASGGGDGYAPGRVFGIVGEAERSIALRWHAARGAGFVCRPTTV